MTSTDKKVTRVTTQAISVKPTVSGRAFGKERRIAVTIMPGDTLILRPVGLRKSEYISIADVYQIAQTRRIKSEAMQRINFKRKGRK